MTTQVATAELRPQRRRLGLVDRVRGLDRFELFLLAMLGLVSCWVMAIDLYQQWVNGSVWTGTDGFFITDQMQYLGWVVSASQHGLIANMFVLRGTPADYFQPAILISGVLVRLGLTPSLALLIWKPVAVVCVWAGIRVYVHHSLPGQRARRVALALGIFYGSLTFLNGNLGVIGDLYPGFLLWGYPFGEIALGAQLLGLVLYDRLRRDGRITPWAGACGALASILHPWNGEAMIAVIVLAELMRLPSEGFRWQRFRLAFTTGLIAGLPLVYYLILGKADHTWTLAREASKHGFPFWPIAMVLLPILPFSILGYRGRSPSFWQSGIRVFPFVCLGLYAFSASGASATPVHAFQGITVPLGVLAVQGVATTRWEQYRHRKLVGTAVLALACVPASIWEMKIASSFMGPGVHNANFIRRGERDALSFLRNNRTPGGVLSPAYLGLTVPGLARRQTFVGDCLWSEPNCSARASAASLLFAGDFTTAHAREVVRHSGAKFLLGDCHSSPKLAIQLKPLISHSWQFGCATVYEVAHTTAPTGPLA